MNEAGARFSQPVAVDRLAARGEIAVTFRPEGEAALAAIAERLRIPAVPQVLVRWTLRAVAGGAIEASGELTATVVQECVVTLEPFEAPVAESFRVLFVPEEQLGEDEFDDDPEAPDTIPYDGRSIDLGEASVEQLALALDPFPRKPGVAFSGDEDEEEEALPEKLSPFAALAARRKSGQDET